MRCVRKRYALPMLVVAACVVPASRSSGQVEGPLDPIQQAVIDSLEASVRLPSGRTPAALLAAAFKANDVGVPAAAERYLGRLAQLADADKQAAPDMFADLADATDDAALVRLRRAMRAQRPEAAQLVEAILQAGRLRRRDPRRLNDAALALASPVAATRLAATDQLLRAGIDGLPALVAVLGREPAADPRQRELARGIVARLGDSARQPLLDWLGTGDPADWTGVIEALGASGADDIEVFLAAPALVPDTPPAARAAAERLLRERADARGNHRTVAPPAREAAVAGLADRLDAVLSPAGLPAIDHLLLEPIAAPAGAAAAFGGSLTGTVGRRLWNPATRAFDAVQLPPRMARAREAMHVARDLSALDARDEAAVELVLLARLEAGLAAAGDPLTALDRLPPAAIREALAGPEGFAIDRAARILEQAVDRGMWHAAAAVAGTLVPEAPPAPAPAGSPGTLPPDVRDTLVRTLAVPDAALQFAAARALALAAGDPPYRGSSRVLETLLYAATSTGADRVVVAHPDAEVVHALAAGVSRFGYEPIRVSTGREAVIAARSSADTVLVLLAARIPKPTAIETVDYLQQQGLGDIAPVLVVVDPLDDDGRGKYLTRLLLSFCDFEGVGIVDRLDSLFLPGIDPETGAASGPPRFPDLLAQAAGPAAVDPGTRNTAAAVRLARAREALGLLGRLARRGWDASPALGTAQEALLHEELYAPAASLLASLPRPAAQAALEQEARRLDLAEASRLVARSAFETSVDRWGILLDSGTMLAAYARYNESADDTTRGAAGDILDVLEAAGRKTQVAPLHAPPQRSRRR